ncbi:charged multivesicular body protein 7-like isoform X2 [Arctopsyche grandis]|uniref:charged multivesicular body protein 7-like isoform X2 n=1 Tax=Arctopsyche grandis TaxID=121162 RepID=UPI00406D80CF
MSNPDYSAKMSIQLMPDCWEDDAKMNSLFAPFRLRGVNPIDWEVKMKFWCNMISQWCESNKKPTFSLDDIKLTFKRKNKTPACLDTVIEHMIKTKIALPKNQMFQVNENGWLSWSTKQLLRPVTWATKTIISTIIPPEPVFQGYSIIIHMESLKKQALAFLASIPDDCHIGSFSELKIASTLDYPLDDEVIHLLIEWLLSEKLATVTSDGQIYKFAPSANVKVLPLTESEISLLQISRTTKKLNEIMTDLDKKMETNHEAAKMYLRKGNKSSALNQLRQKKTIAYRLEKISNNYDTLIQLSETIKQTHVDAEIFNIFKKSLSTLKKTTKEKGLEENIVLDTMDDLKQALDDISDMESAISQPFGQQFDENELEMELFDLTSKADLGNDDGGTVSKPETSSEQKDKEKLAEENLPPTEIESASDMLASKMKIADVI